jgi:hypothetical protein
VAYMNRIWDDELQRRLYTEKVCVNLDGKFHSMGLSVRDGDGPQVIIDTYYGSFTVYFDPVKMKLVVENKTDFEGSGPMKVEITG